MTPKAFEDQIELLLPKSATTQIDQRLFYLINDYKELIGGREKDDWSPNPSQRSV